MEHKTILWRRFLSTSMVFITTITVSLAQISGAVKDPNGEPLIGVSVLQKGTTKGVVTDANGTFNINVPSGTMLRFSSIGYGDVEIPAENNMTAVMSEDAQAIEDVVITGYGGTVSKAKATSSISSLNKQVLQTGVRSSPAQALAGTIPGLRVQYNSGRPGSAPNIYLRGGTGFDGTGSPLVIVDGQLRDGMNDINPEDIESMDVLKDAASTSIYGARASNGVILITTKKGKVGQSSIQVKAQVGVNFLNRPYKMVSTEEYIAWQRRAAFNSPINPTSGLSSSINNLNNVSYGIGNYYKDIHGNVIDGVYDTPVTVINATTGQPTTIASNSAAVWSVMRLSETNRELLSKPGWKAMKDVVPTNIFGSYDPNGEYYDLIYKDYDASADVFNAPSITQDYNVSMSGGNEKGSYYANLGFYNENGFPQNSFYRRFTGVLNGDYQIKKWLKSETNINYAKANWDDAMYNGEAAFWSRTLSIIPTFRRTNEDGVLLNNGRGGADETPLLNDGRRIRDNQTDKFTLGQYLNFSIIDGLKLRLGGILMYDEGVTESFNRDLRSGASLNLSNPNTGWTQTRSTSADFRRTLRQTYNAVLSYKTTIVGLHNVDAMIGSEFYDSYYRGFNASGQGAPTDDFQDLGLTSTDKGLRSIDSWHSRQRIMSYFGRVNYDFDSKYLFSFTIRGDGYSKLLGDNRWGVFPGVSAGWLIHRESFMESTKDWLSTLKIRLSYGINGDVGGIGDYQLQGGFDTNKYDQIAGYLYGTLPNPGLKWEQSKTWEPAVELGFLRNRITASVSFYNRITDNKIGNINLPTSSGIASVLSNNGSLQNRGVEFDISATILEIQDFKWTASINGAWNWNKILKLPDNGIENNRQGGTQIYDPASGKVIWVGGYQEGQEWGEVFGYISEGLIRTEEDLAKYQKLDLVTISNSTIGGNTSRPVISKSQYDALPGNQKSTYYHTVLGDVMWKDIDGNDTIDTRDRVSLGRTIPRFTGGFNTTLSWRGITLFVRTDFAFGHVQSDGFIPWSLGNMQGAFAPTTHVRDTWTPENPNARFPIYTWADQNFKKNFDRPSNMFYRNSSYLAFREVSLSYDLPKIWLEKIKMQGLRITATAQNLGYITDDLLKLPERTGAFEVNGGSAGAYIIPTTLIFGATLTF